MSYAIWLLVAGIIALGWILAFRYWMLRTWRTVLVLALGTTGLVGAMLLAPSPLGLIVGTTVGGLTWWVVASGSQFLLSMAERDRAYDELLRDADAAESAVLSQVGNTLGPADARAALIRILRRLDDPVEDPDWSAARDLRVEALELAITAIEHRVSPSSSDVERLRTLREQARQAFLAARRAKSRFWR